MGCFKGFRRKCQKAIVNKMQMITKDTLSSLRKHKREVFTLIL